MKLYHRRYHSFRRQNERFDLSSPKDQKSLLIWNAFTSQN